VVGGHALVVVCIWYAGRYACYVHRCILYLHTTVGGRLAAAPSGHRHDVHKLIHRDEHSIVP